MPRLGATLLLVLAAAAPAQHLSRRPTPLTHGIEPFRQVVRCFATWQGDTWFGTYGSGLYRLPPAGPPQRFTSQDGGLLEDRVNGLAVHQGKLQGAGFNPPGYVFRVPSAAYVIFRHHIIRHW